MYICSIKTFKVVSVIAGHEGTITCLIWSPFNENLIASASLDNNFYIWDIFEEKAKVHVSLPAYPLMMQWSGTDPNCILLLLSTGKIVRDNVIGEVKLLNLELRKVDKIANFSGISPTILRWHPKNVCLNSSSPNRITS